VAEVIVEAGAPHPDAPAPLALGMDVTARSTENVEAPDATVTRAADEVVALDSAHKQPTALFGDLAAIDKVLRKSRKDKRASARQQMQASGQLALF
jgi:hypothetical protein